MVRALGAVLGPDDRVLVVDDNSPDGTGASADRLAGELPFVGVLHRPRKEGLGPAYLAGFRLVEVPITFVDREVGGSKMSRAIVLEAIWKVPALRLAALRGRLR